MEDKRKFLDFVKKLASRKLLVFVVATVLLVVGKISEDIWLYTSVFYVGANVAQAFLSGGIFKKQQKIEGTISGEEENGEA